MASKAGTVKTPEQVAMLRQAGQVVVSILARLGRLCMPGVSTQTLASEAGRMIREAGCTSLFSGYPNNKRNGPPFTDVVCISVNEQIVHGVPGPRRLKRGDLVSVDCGVRYKGWCGDSAWTFAVGGMASLPERTRSLMRVSKQVLDLAVSRCRPGIRWSVIASQMERFVQEAGFGVVHDFVGHGIGQEMHELPQVPNYADRESRSKMDFELVPGMVLCIEPMVTMGDASTRVLEDMWTVATRDGGWATHFEHMVWITDRAAEALTRHEELEHWPEEGPAPLARPAGMPMEMAS